MNENFDTRANFFLNDKLNYQTELVFESYEPLQKRLEFIKYLYHLPDTVSDKILMSEVNKLLVSGITGFEYIEAPKRSYIEDVCALIMCAGTNRTTILENGKSVGGDIYSLFPIIEAPFLHEWDPRFDEEDEIDFEDLLPESSNPSWRMSLEDAQTKWDLGDPNPMVLIFAPIIDRLRKELPGVLTAVAKSQFCSAFTFRLVSGFFPKDSTELLDTGVYWDFAAREKLELDWN